MALEISIIHIPHEPSTAFYDNNNDNNYVFILEDNILSTNMNLSTVRSSVKK